MATFTESYARLADDSYDEGKKLKDSPFVVLRVIGKASGYHGVIYQNKETQELVVVHRGTEFEGDKIRDLAITDAQMALFKVNQQLDGARETVELAIELAKKSGATVTIAGHSLGGTLTQITAREYGLKGETFNAYGAAGLYDLPAGGNQVVNHVRVTDMVSAAGKHYGSVKPYALQADVDALLGDKTLPAQQNRIQLLQDVMELNPGKTHGMVQFYGGKRGMEEKEIYGANSIINAESQALYEKHKDQFDAYREDIHNLAGDLSKGVLLTGAGLAYSAALAQQHVLNKASMAFGHNEEIHQLRNAERGAISARNKDFRPPEEPLIFRDQASQGVLPDLREEIERYTTPKRAPETQVELTPADATYKSKWHGEKPAINGDGASELEHHPRHQGNVQNPLNASHPDHPLFMALKVKLPGGASDDVVAHVMLQAKIGGVARADQLDRVAVQGDHAFVMGKTPGDRAKVDISTASPSMQDTMQRSEAFDQQQVQQLAQFREQQWQINQQQTGPKITV